MTAGKRAGSRRGSRRRATFQPALLGYALAITGCVVAWGYLVYAAVDFGATARGGESTAWWFLVVASTGAVACLFFGLILIARMLRRLGIIHRPDHDVDRGVDPGVDREATEQPPRPIGGRHAG